MRTTITIADDLFRRADQVAEELGISRSRLYQRAVEHYLRMLRDDALTLRANETVAEYGQPMGASFGKYIKKAWGEGLGDDEW
jgi:predicted transcriptional regulator